MTASVSTIRRHDALYSTWLPDARGVTVYLPPGYDQRRSRYPVLFMHDGQNLFDPARAHVPGQHWRVPETADALVRAGLIDPVVIVGIDHAREQRVADFTPTSAGRRDAGRAARYANFLVAELLPFIGETYHVRNDFNGRGLGGSSLGGLVTLVIALAHPGTFGRLLVMSPSVWWDRAVILGRLQARPLDPPPRIWLDAGAREGRKAVSEARKLRDVLRRCLGPASARLLRYEEDREGDHSEDSWARRLPGALEFLFPPTVESDQE